jgi:hypothetical protein
LAPVSTLPLTTTTTAQEAAMYHQHITRALAEADVAGEQLPAARWRPTASVRPRHRQRALAAALVAIGTLSPAPSALAQPARDAGTSMNQQATLVARDHRPRGTLGTITLTNPLGRSRGPGAGAGLL